MKRHLLRHFVDVKMDTSSEGTAADYRLLGTGITSLTEEMNPETETVQYINQENGSTDLKRKHREQCCFWGYGAV